MPERRNSLTGEFFYSHRVVDKDGDHWCGGHEQKPKQTNELQSKSLAQVQVNVNKLLDEMFKVQARLDGMAEFLKSHLEHRPVETRPATKEELSKVPF